MTTELVCTKETAERLAKAGIHSVTVFSWQNNGPSWVLVPTNKVTAAEFIPAYTASEAASFFPSEVWVTVNDASVKRRDAFFQFAKHNGIYKVSLMVAPYGTSNFFELYREEDPNEAEARSKMLAYLHENRMLPQNKE